MMDRIRPGTVLAVRSSGFAGFMIRLGSAFTGKPNLDNHIAVAHHIDEHGTLWCVEGRPGGVGWRDATSYINSPWTLTNVEQPFTEVQGAAVAHQMEVLLGTKYDWDAIVADGFADLGMRLPGWDSKWKGLVAGQVVCSSAAAYAYAKEGVPHPAGERGCQPSDWDQWILTKAWEHPSVLPPGRTAPQGQLRGGFFMPLRAAVIHPHPLTWVIHGNSGESKRFITKR